MSGAVMIARSIFDHELFADQPLTEREAWIWLIMEAAWKPRKKRAGDVIADLERGQLAASVRFMAGAWRWTPAKVQRFIKRLQNLEMILLKTDTGVSVITICNYNEYQAKTKAADTGPIQDRYRTDTNDKKGIKKEVKEEDNPPPPFSTPLVETAAEEGLIELILVRLMAAVGVTTATDFWQPAAAMPFIEVWRQSLTDDQIIAAAKASRVAMPIPPNGPKALHRVMAAAKSINEKSIADPAADRAKAARFYAGLINGKNYVAPSAISTTIRAEMIQQKLVTESQLRERGIQ